MKKNMLIGILSFGLGLPLILGVEAHAIDGRTAVGQCIDRGPDCQHWRFPDGSIEIVVCNGRDCHVIDCPSATAQCTITFRAGRPKHGDLPKGKPNMKK